MNTGTHLSLPANGIFNFEECLWFLNRDFDDCMHSMEGNTLYKATTIGAKPCLLHITGDEHSINATILEGEAGHSEGAAAFIRQWFDLDRDLAPFYTLLQANKKLAYMANSFYGLRRMGIPDIFEALCWSIIGQQINLSFAYRMKRRLTERYGTFISFASKQYWLFPQPEVLAGADINELRAMQFSQKKAEYLIGLAQLFARGDMSRAILESLPGFAAQHQALTAVRGIGIWTANYALMKSLGRAEAIPFGDVGLLQALVNHDIMSDRKDQQAIDQLFRQFAGWETYLVLYLWRSLAPKENEK